MWQAAGRGKLLPLPPLLRPRGSRESTPLPPPAAPPHLELRLRGDVVHLAAAVGLPEEGGARLRGGAPRRLLLVQRVRVGAARVVGQVGVRVLRVKLLADPGARVQAAARGGRGAGREAAACG